MNRWQAGATLDLTVPCSGTVHAMVWRDGGIELVDHPELDAERALIGLGGEEPKCLADLRLWDDAVGDGGFLAEWVDETHLSAPRLSWLTMALERMNNEGFHEFLRHLPIERAERMGRFLRHFPRPWLDRAAAAVAEAIVDGDGVRCRHAAELLPTAIANRVRRSFVSSIGGNQLAVGAAALVPLTIEVTRNGEPRAAGHLSGPDRGVSLTVTWSWLHEVWSAGANVIDGHLVLGRCQPQGSPELFVVSWNDETGSFSPRLERRPASCGRAGWTLDPTPPS